MEFKKNFEEKIVKELKEKLKVKSVMAVPRVVKIVVNMSSKEFLKDKKNIERSLEELTQITGQKPKISKARISIATFKLREGDKIGMSVTLRGQRMYDFLEKLIKVVFPRVKDFSGLPFTAFDGRGNISFGFDEQVVFPEIDSGKVDILRSLQVTIVTNAKEDDKAKMLLKALGMPFVKIDAETGKGKAVVN